MNDANFPSTRQEQLAYRTSLIFTLSALVSAIAYLGLISSGYNQWQMWGTFIGIVLFVLTGLGAIALTRSGQYEPGIHLLLSGAYLVSIVGSVLIAGIGLPLAPALIIITLAVTTSTLTQRGTTRIFFVSVGVGIFTTLMDVINVPWHLVIPNLPAYTSLGTGLVSAIFIIVILRQFNRLTVTNKLLVGFTGLTLLVSFAQGIFMLRNLAAVVEESATQQLGAAAEQSAAVIDRYLSTNLATVDAAAQVPLLSAYLQLSNDLKSRNAMDGEVNQFMRNLRSADLKNISGYLLLDSKGHVVKDTTGYMFPYSAQTQYAERDFFTQPRDLQQPYISLPQFTDKPNPASAYIYLAAPIIDPRDNTFLGVLAARYRANALQTLVSGLGSKLGENSFAALYAPLERNFIQLAHGTRPETSLALIGPESAAHLVALQNRGYTSLQFVPTTTLDMPDLLQSLRAANNDPLFVAPETYAPLAADNETDATDDPYQAYAVPLQSANWLVAYFQQQSALTASVDAQVNNNQLLGLLVTALATIAAVFFAQAISRPVTEMEAAARRMAAGNLETRVTVTSEDDIGRLGETLNLLADRLQTSLQEMEDRIQSRTADLARRNAQIQAAAEVGRAANQIRDIERLLPQVTELISERFGFYHVGIFLLDARGEYAVLRAANSMGGQRMLARGHKLRVGQVGIVGYVTGNRKARIALDVGEDAVYFDNPDLPNTRSEMAVPLMVRDELLGALDIQSTQPNAFTQDDVEVIQVLADQLSIAIANARLFAENQRALEEIRTAYGEVTRKAWFELLSLRRTPAFTALEDRVVPTQTTWDADALRAVQENRPIPAATPDERGCYRLTLPVQAGNIPMGAISAWKQGAPWTEVETDLLQTILRELSLALESSRLFEEAQRRAQLEQVSAQVVTRLRETLDIQAMLRTAAQEIRQAFSLPEVSVRLTGLQPGDGDQSAE